VRVLTGSSKLGGLRLLDDHYELVAYTQTNENGEFTFPNLPTGDYRIRIEYPGVETDEAAEVNFNLSGELGEIVSVAALVEDGQITVTETGREFVTVSNTPHKVMNLSYYPNPAKNELNLKLENSDNIQTLTILDLKGTIRSTFKLENGQNQIDISYLNSGMYILRVKDEDGNYMISKMIKE
jgi:hypothetical protein